MCIRDSKNIRAGRGNDAVELSGSSNDYSITNSGKTTIYTGPDGSRISVRGVEQVFFSGSRELLDVGQRTPVPSETPEDEGIGQVDDHVRCTLTLTPDGDIVSSCGSSSDEDESPVGQEFGDVDPDAPIGFVPSDDESPVGRELGDVDPDAPITVVPSEVASIPVSIGDPDRFNLG